MATNNFNVASGEWNTAANWSLGTVPVATNDCTFTALNGTLTITTTGAVCKSLDFSGAISCAVTGSVGIQVFGNVTLKAASDWSGFTGNLIITAKTVSITSTVNLNGCILKGNLYLGNLATSYSTTITLAGNAVFSGECLINGGSNSAGTVTLNLNGYSLSCNNLWVTAGYYAAINAGAGGGFIFTGVSGVLITLATSAYLTVTNSPSITLTGTITSSNATLDFGGFTWGMITLSGTYSAGTITLSDFAAGQNIILNPASAADSKMIITLAAGIAVNITNNYVSSTVAALINGTGTLALTMGAGSFTKLLAGATFTITTLTCNGAAGKLAKLNSSSTSVSTISAASGTFAVNYLNMSYIAATGGATWEALLGCMNTVGNTGWLWQATYTKIITLTGISRKQEL